MSFLKSTALALLLLVASIAGAQRADSALATLASQYPAEKVFIHYDKETYVAGETIWFKAYLTSNGLPSGMSTSFYVQMEDSKGGLVAAARYPIMGATTKGQIDLPDSLPRGNYIIKASTPAMLQYGNDFVYQKNIFVFNPQTKKASAAASSKSLQVKFYPESGYLVDGILTVVGFKATTGDGNPVDVNGVIRTEDGTAICSFKSYYNGIGKTQFKPQAGKKYKAEVEMNGLMNTYALPEVQQGGINLKLQDEKGGKMFLLARGAKDKSLFSSVRIVAQMNNQIVYETDVEFEDYPSVKGHLITDSLPSGIMHFTVFNSEGLPIAERLSFVNNREYLGAVELNPTKKDLTKKALNEFEIRFPDSIQRSLSVSITDASVPLLADKENIWSALLLSGDLKGYIHNPAWYFQPMNDSVGQALDNLMLTHGWSRFEWKKLLAKQYPQPYREEKFISVSGIVNEDNDKAPVNGGKLNIYLESADSSSQNYDVNIDNNGQFRMDSLVYQGNSKFFYAYSNSQGKQRAVKIHLDPQSISLSPSFFQTVSRKELASLEPLSGNEYAASQFQSVREGKDRVKELERVVVQARSSKKPIEIVNEKYSTGVFRTMGKVNIDNINQPANDKSMNVIDFIKNRIQQVELQGNKFVSRKNFSLINGQKWTVDVFLDESPVNAALLRTLRADDIALVKYYDAGFVGVGSNAPGGAIAVYTKKKGNESAPVEKLEYFTVNGYSVQREFFSPDYSTPDANLQVPDYRSTIYWNPNIYTDTESNTIPLKFFNNDKSKKLRVVVEGFDVNGKLIHLEKWIE